MIEWKETVAGACGAIACAYSGNPFDVIKIRLQTQQEFIVNSTHSYKGPVDCFIKIVKFEGVISLWKGVIPSLTSSMIENSVLFSVNGLLKRLYHDHISNEGSLSFIESALIGGISAVFSATCITPAELIKCRLQVQRDVKRKSPITAIAEILKSKGPKGLFTGLTGTLSRDVPFTFFFFGGYETWTYALKMIPSLKSSNIDEADKLNSIGIFLAGGLAGSTSWSIIFPMDSVKSRMQTSDMTSPSKINFLSVAKIIYNSQGVTGFYRGWSSAIMRAFPANAALFLGYETAMSLLVDL